MKATLWIMSFIALFLMAGLASAEEEPAVKLTTRDGVSFSQSRTSFGWEFTVAGEIDITHLGLAFNSIDSQVNYSHTVSIYDTSDYDPADPSTLPLALVSADISNDSTGGSGPEADGYWYKDVLSQGAKLRPGTTYVVAFYASNAEYYIATLTDAPEFHSMINPVSARLALGDVGLRMPATSWGDYMFLGASFKFMPATPSINNPPVIDSVTIAPAALGTPSQVTAVFSDGPADTHTITVDWGSGPQPPDAVVTDPETGDRTVTASNTYDATGVHTVTVTVTDSKNEPVSREAYAAVYDPMTSFVTGGGWITTGDKANFGFVCKYLKNAANPSGQLQFQDGTVNFHSTTYDWLAVSDGIAQFAGVGTINGEGDHYFVVTITDEPDTFEIDIFDIDYYSGPQPLGGGQIKIHQK